MTSPDKNVEAIRQKLLDRSEVGLKKYGTTTERADIDFVGWLDHMQQELMDGAIYAQAAKEAHADTDTLEQEVRQVRARLARVEAELAAIVPAAIAVIERWHSPLWKDLPHTGTYIQALEQAVAKVQP